jgi:hypothetical protein
MSIEQHKDHRTGKAREQLKDHYTRMQAEGLFPSRCPEQKQKTERKNGKLHLKQGVTGRQLKNDKEDNSFFDM